MATLSGLESGWTKIDGSWYYYDSNDEMSRGWKYVDDGIYNGWYYFYDDGSMAWDTTVDGYYVNDSGKWIPPNEGNTESNEGGLIEIPSTQITDGAAVTYDGTELPEENSIINIISNGTVVRKFKDINEFFKYQLLIGMGEKTGEEGVIYVTDEEEGLADAGADMLTTELGGDFVVIIANGVRVYKNIKTGEIIYNENYVAGSGLGNIEKGVSNTAIKAGKNFKDHFIRHKGLLEKVTGKKYPKYKTDGQEFLNDVGKIIEDGTVKYVGKGTLKKGQPAVNIYRGNGITVVTKEDGEFVTIIESGQGLDLGIQMLE